MGMTDALRKAADVFGVASAGYDEYDSDDGYALDDREESVSSAGREYFERLDWQDGGARRLSLVSSPHLTFGVVAPQDFDGVQRIADDLRAGKPVVVDLSGCQLELARRVIDFCSGLSYALEGTLQYVEREVLLLAPSEIELSGTATFGLMAKGFFNQA